MVWFGGQNKLMLQ